MEQRDTLHSCDLAPFPDDLLPCPVSYRSSAWTPLDTAFTVRFGNHVACSRREYTGSLLVTTQNISLCIKTKSAL